MPPSETIRLQRDCDAVAIPIGTRHRLSAGESVQIQQTLGGSFTVMAQGRLFRIATKDADALGKNVKSAKPAAMGPLNEDRVLNQLKGCFDPEIPVNIVDLGLVYDVQITRLAEAAHRVEVKMTLTAPGCGMGPVIAKDVEEKLLQLPGVTEAIAHLVWDPPWSREMMSEAARLELGLM